MPKFDIYATRTHNYTVQVEAEDWHAAKAYLDDWIADDFEDYETNAQWDFDVVESDQ